MRPAPRLFVDASVLIAASGSSAGASALVLVLCRHGHARPVASRRVLLEAQRNIRVKLGEEALLRFYQHLGDLDLDLVEDPTPREVDAYVSITGPKDAHVLAGAVKGVVDVLLTLDRKHLLTPRVRDAGLPCAVLTPGEFLERLSGR